MVNTGEHGDELGISPFAGHKAYFPRKSAFMPFIALVRE